MGCLLLVSCHSYASNSFSCGIKDISTSMSTPHHVVVHMNCESGNPIASGTNSCTGAVISKDSFTFDTSTEHGKLNLSVVLMAFASGKNIYASTYSSCPSNSPSTPILYSLKVYGG